MLYILFLSIGVAIALVIFVTVARNFAKPKLNPSSSALIRKKWNGVLALTDPHRKILEADAVLDLALKELGYQGSLGDKLKRAGKFFPNENAVWKVHKLRNRIAHEPGTQVSDRELQEGLHVVQKTLEMFLRP